MSGPRLALVAAALVALTAAAFVLRRAPEEARAAKKSRALTTASELSAAETRPISRAEALEIAGRSFATGRVSRDEILALLREAADARRAGDHEKCGERMGRIVALGGDALRLLAWVVLESADEDEAYLAALAVQQLATEEAIPFALALLRTDRPASVLGVAIEILTRFRAAEAAPYVEAVLFRADGDPHLKALSIAFFGAMGDAGVPVLARAVADDSFGLLRERAAEALASIGTPAAGKAIYEAWRGGFDASAAMGSYFLLQSLAKFEPGILREYMREALRDDDPSRSNVLLSLLGRADRAFALDQVREVLAADVAPSTRGQAILVLGAVGGEEAQAILLDLLARPRAEQDFAESANALMMQARLAIPFEKVLELYAAAEHPMARAVLASLLAKYDEPLAGDRALALSLVEEAQRGLRATDPAQRALSLQLSAQLARHTADPAGHLMSLYEVDRHPAVLAEMARHGSDDRVRPALESSLDDEESAVPQRVLAAQGLLEAGGTERVYATIGRSRSPELTAMLVGLVAAREGKAGVRRLAEVATAIGDPERRRAVEEQLRALSSGN